MCRRFKSVLRYRPLHPFSSFPPFLKPNDLGVVSVMRERALGIDQSWIDPGAGCEGGAAGIVVGPGVGGAACSGAGIWDAALGGGSELTGGVSTDLSSSLCGGRNRVKGGLIGPGGGPYTGGPGG